MAEISELYIKNKKTGEKEVYEIEDKRSRKSIEQLEESETKNQKQIKEIASKLLGAGIIADAITSKLQGNVITISDASDRPLEKITFLGKSTQAVTTGAQLFDVNDKKSTASGFTFLEDDWVNFQYDNTAGETDLYFNNMTNVSDLLKESTDYKLVVEIKTFNGSGGVYGCSSEDDANRGQFTQRTMASKVGTHTVTVTTRDDFSACTSMLRNFVKVSAGASINVTFRISIIADTSITADTFIYEKFTGGKAAPNIDYPIDIVSVGDDGNVKLEITGRNLLDLQTPISSSVNSYEVSDDGYIATAKGTGAFSGLMFAVPKFLHGHTVYLSYDSIESDFNGSVLQLCVTKADGSKTYHASTTLKELAITIPSDAKNAIARLLTNNSGDASDTELITTVKGYRLSLYPNMPWTPYVGSQSASIGLSEPLRGLIVSSGGDYTDADGQQWIADTLEVFADGTGKLIRRISKYDINGESITKYGDGTTLGSRIEVRLEKAGILYRSDSQKGCKSMCNASALGKDGGTWGTPYVYTVNDVDGYGKFYLSLEGTETLAEFKEILNETPIELLCTYITPIETQLTAEQVQEFLAIHSYYPHTVIASDSLGEIEVQYIADTQAYIDNKFNEIAKAIVATAE